MSNDYYSASGAPSTGGALASAAVRSEFAAIQAAFDLLPDLTSVGNRIPHINAGSTAITTTSGFTFDGTTFSAPKIAVASQPNFLACTTADNLTATGDDTVYTATFGTSIWDVGSNFNGTQFTAPAGTVAGSKFLFNVKIKGGVGAGYTRGIITLVTTKRSYVLWQGNPSAVLNSASTSTISVSQIANMDAGDTAYVTYSVGGSTKNWAIEGDGTTAKSSFSGYQLP